MTSTIDDGAPDACQYWAPEHIARLKAERAADRTFEEVRQILNGAFGTRYTRAAVIGKAHRLRILGVRGKRIPAARPGPDIRREQPRAPKPWKPQVDLSLDVAFAIGPEIPDVWDGRCKWPYGDPRDESFRFCGRSRDKASSPPYCAGHRELSFSTARRKLDLAEAA
jgi:GcrA cell cycle regulator